MKRSLKGTISVYPPRTQLYSVSEPNETPRIWFDNLGKAIFWGKLFNGKLDDLVLKELITDKKLHYITLVSDKSVLDDPRMVDKRLLALVKIEFIDEDDDRYGGVGVGFSDVSLISKLKLFSVDWLKINATFDELLNRTGKLRAVEEWFVQNYLRLVRKRVVNELGAYDIF